MGMELHEQLSIAIAVSDARYTAGRLLNAGGHPRSWLFSQWGVMVAFETQKHLKDVHGTSLNFDWEDDVAEAVRHGGKFFDVRSTPIDSILDDFRLLAEATTRAYYPEERRGRAFDFLRADLSVVCDKSELVLTNVTGHFMIGLSPHLGADLNLWEPHIRTLTMGIGQMAGALTGMNVQEISVHGSHIDRFPTYLDGDIAKVIPATFGGEFDTDLALSVISIQSTVQSARRWAHAECCNTCIAAALKHRFVILHHAVRSILQLRERAEVRGPVAAAYLKALSDSADLQKIASKPFRKLRNGWFHLGLGDIAADLPKNPNILSPVITYTRMEIEEFADLVNRCLNLLAETINEWLLEGGDGGFTLFDFLRQPSE